MMMETVMSRSIRLVFAGGMVLGLGVAANAQAQEQASTTQRVEVTGSSIKRIAAEGALPVTIVTAAEIRASGVTSAVDLVRKLSTVQGSTGESASVGGSTFGFSGVSIHNVGETRTLVLLNGKRLAQFGGQTLTGFAAGFDLNAIPLSAIERVELLTDGASALYGADAIAGVVNFITKHNSTDGDVTLGYSAPANGAVEKRFSATKGFGSVEEDGYNVMLTFGHDERTNLKSVDRSFANTGKRTFSQGGVNYVKQQFSPSPIPANALDDQGQLISPYQKVNGTCPNKTFRVIEPYTDGSGLVDDYCGYDFVKDLQINPERKRDSFMASVIKKIGSQELYADLLLSTTKQTSRIAPVPGSISIPAGSPLHTKYLLPLGITQDSLAFYRLFDIGPRTSNDTADFSNIVVGSRGEMMGWDYNLAYNHSQSDVKGNISGYPGALAVSNLRKSGLLDPFVGPGQQSPAAVAAIAKTRFSGYWDGGVSELDTVSLNGSRELVTLPGGPLMLGVGINFNKEKFESKPSLFAQGKLSDPVAGTLCDGTAANPCDQRFGDESAVLPYSASRNSKGIFGELVIPAMKTLEFGLATRLDSYSDFGSATTAKASVRWTPVSTVLVRASIGNGFHAPTVPQVNAAPQSYGVTSDKYTCSPGSALAATAARLGSVCQPGNKQYDQIAGGNSRLQPEKSKQGTLGIRFEPNSSISLGADLWHVQIRDSFGQLTEQLVFSKPNEFPNSWGTKKDTGTGVTYLAFVADNQNLGKSYATGLDLDFTARTKTSFGQLSSQLTLTHMLREVSQQEKNGDYYSAVGNFDTLGTVTFRTQGRFVTGLKTGDFTNTLALNFKSGYKDLPTDVQPVDAAGAPVGDPVTIRKEVGWTSTWDFQTVWAPTKTWTITGGILNVLDRDPPFVPSTAGANRGQQFGYDDRYYDSRGRTFYVNGSYKF
jgi:iron complex outermembrane receptor protein